MDYNGLIEILHQRFIEHGWHDEGCWAEIEKQLARMNFAAIHWMEETGGEPAIAPWWLSGQPLAICDCSKESPIGRRSLCYDRAAWEKRKSARPKGDATSIAESHGTRLMSETEYIWLQSAGEFDTKTSSWLHTDNEVRSRGGAIFGDRRFGRTFIYCNGAESYYGVRGFRVVVA